MEKPRAAGSAFRPTLGVLLVGENPNNGDVAPERRADLRPNHLIPSTRLILLLPGIPLGQNAFERNGLDIPAATSDAAGLPSLHTAKGQPRRCSSHATRQPASPSPTINTCGDSELINSPRAPRVRRRLCGRLRWPDPVAHGCGLRQLAPGCALRLSGPPDRRTR